jgi:hypothetical protein
MAAGHAACINGAHILLYLFERPAAVLLPNLILILLPLKHPRDEWVDGVMLLHAR